MFEQLALGFLEFLNGTIGQINQQVSENLK